jgi:hypothetical protein
LPSRTLTAEERVELRELLLAWGVPNVA